jgi:hypothetical protein
VAQLKLNADWVALSACNTAAGEKPGAEAFFYAGARTLLVSHWRIDSKAASLSYLRSAGPCVSPIAGKTTRSGFKATEATLTVATDPKRIRCRNVPSPPCSGMRNSVHRLLQRLGSRYRSGRSRDWLKFKNLMAPGGEARSRRGLG